ncbi:MAG TPA: hypothetical protein VFY84_20280 [Jiangellales bacterium]|nr:hypothetical protein [Jiangellales bacterium]
MLGIAVTSTYALSQHWPAVVPAWASAGRLGATPVIGAFAGLFPAMRAAGLAPTEALATTLQRPAVALNRVVIDVTSVVIDNELGMRRAIEHLADLGRRIIAYAAGPAASWRTAYGTGHSGGGLGAGTQGPSARSIRSHHPWWTAGGGRSRR